ncbi:MAG: chemotaxis protein CheW [Oscillospiraceae bacterium]|jgi:purine-binding chemotaxis protein CheW|nr:chemotaxis protein CheW [Oscillospiraceae bacterium]MCI1990115.1 chemotaxis protein CheW [Oscillospiraceae bacterium]MCI2034494.1 chemotaxis protein CheW [Oscillospiraceae bacterium]
MKNFKKSLKEKDPAAEAAMEKYLTFYIDDQLYSVPTSRVVEIIRMQPITFMPNVTDYVKGVINLRGKVVPVLDMRLRFHKEEKAYDARTSIIIVENGDMTVGLIVDAVKDVRDVAASQINPAPKSKKVAGSGFVNGIAALGNESAMLLDVTKVLTHRNAENKKKEAKADSEHPQDQSAAQ